MKYVMLQHDLATVKQKVPIIFPDHLVHKDVAEVMVGVLRLVHGFRNVRAVSAGEINLEDCTCYGRSETLGLSADPVDGVVIRTYQYTGGMS